MKHIQLHKSPLFLKIIFVISVAIIFFIGGITFKHITVLKKSSAYVSNSYEVNIELERLLSCIKDAETGQRGYLLTRDKKFLRPYHNSGALIKKSYQRISELTANSRTQQSNLKKLQYHINRRLNYLSKNLYLIEQKNYKIKTLDSNFVTGQKAMDSIRYRIQSMIITQKILLKNRQKDYESTMNYTPLLIYLTLIITLILITIAFVKMNRDLILLKNTIDTLTIAIEANKLSEIVGNFGSWQLDIETFKYSFSDNEYRLLGCEPQSFEASKEEYFKFIHPDDLESVKESVKNVSINNAFIPITYRIIRKDGEVRYFKDKGQIVSFSSDKKTFIGTTRDITSEINDRITTEERNRELESNNKELSAFNYIASHDLQEPLRKIETFISRLVSKDYDNLSSSGQQYISSIQKSTNRMRVLIEDLLQFSRTNKMEKTFEEVDLNTLLENAKQELAQIIEDKKAKIENSALPILKVIPFQMQQLLINLIGNSLKYSSQDRTPIIKIDYSKVIANEEELLPETHHKYHRIIIKDNGIGFDQEYAKNIFVLFNRLHNKNEYQGTGIGLAICKKIVENHKGFIFAKGIVDKGSDFIIYLPAE
ncbi:CHASE3 domain-containing protein [Flavobacterium sp. I-SCBP12n]|uniref:histidine kinase n=2 Tax=Flavobacterium TaxID=237 RepID=A0A9X1XQS0_9FLAO|nr:MULTISPECIES: CHASE3 domain-containing protein [Flavobacterium]MBP4141614.1 CHASE3 domain-containing protein [Flavobacterium flabelliforme]MCK8141344.1 CHASE3 domain-containing protein [Flavobacterium pygoscelis]